MAVPEGERRPCKMDVFMHELDLVTYTLQITRNEKIFLPEYKAALRTILWKPQRIFT